MSRRHTVRQGECLARIARLYGFHDWRLIYNHSENAAFRELRPNPNVIWPGDVINIPDPESRTEDGATDQRHRFRVRRAEPVKLRLRLRNRWGYPFKNYHYKIKIAGIVQTGRTDDMGQIEVPSLPVDAERGVLFAWLVDKEGAPTGLIRWELLLGHLDPNEEMSGVQGRLLNLGYDVGSADGIMGPRSRRALREFQGRVPLVPTGQPDDTTRAKLKQAHEKT